MSEDKKIRLELTPEAMDGKYTNFSVITHSTGEFIIDFARVVPGKPVAKVYSRIIMSPINFKLFKKAIDENLENYELKNGRISLEGVSGVAEPKDFISDNSDYVETLNIEERKNEFKKLFGIDKDKKQ